VAVLATNRHYTEALDLLDIIEELLNKSKHRRSIWGVSLDYAMEVSRLRAIIIEDVQTETSKDIR